MKKILRLFAIICLLIASLAAFSSSAKNPLTEDNPSDSQTEELSIPQVENIFRSEEEFYQHIKETNELKAYLVSRAKKDGLKEDTVQMFSPDSVPAGFELEDISYSYAYISYTYATTSSQYENYGDLKKDERQMEVLNAGKTPVEMQQQEEIQREMDELGRDGYIEKYGFSEDDLATIEYITGVYTFTWSAESDGELLYNQVQDFSLEESSTPGYYYELLSYPGVDEDLLISIYWAEKGYSFHVNIPIESAKLSYTKGKLDLPLEFLKAKGSFLELDW